jgi:hypothetical protein
MYLVVHVGGIKGAVGITRHQGPSRCGHVAGNGPGIAAAPDLPQFIALCRGRRQLVEALEWWTLSDLSRWKGDHGALGGARHEG